MPANFFIDQNNCCACVGNICHQDLGALGGRDMSLDVDVALHWWEVAGQSKTLPLLFVSGCWRRWEFLLVKPQWSSA